MPMIRKASGRRIGACEDLRMSKLTKLLAAVSQSTWWARSALAETKKTKRLGKQHSKQKGWPDLPLYTHQGMWEGANKGRMRLSHSSPGTPTRLFFFLFSNCLADLILQSLTVGSQPYDCLLAHPVSKGTDSG